MESTTYSTRVQAPALLGSSLAVGPSTTERMTSATESPRREGNRPIDRRGGSHFPDMRRMMIVGTWNVLTLSPDGYAEALSRELSKYRAAFVGLTEVRWPGNGREVFPDYTLFYSGGNSRTYGVGIMVSNSISTSLISWTPISDRLLRARFKHQHGGLSVIVVYAPTEEAESNVKDAFYAQLEAVTAIIPPHDQLLVLGDFNAVSGTERLGYEDVIGNFGSGYSNDNSHRLISFCCTFGLSIMGSWFRRLDIHRHTWISNDGHTRKEIDHILCRDRRDIHSCRVFRGAEGPANTDHRLVLADMSISIKHQRNNNSRRKLDVDKLKEIDKAESYRNALLADGPLQDTDSLQSVKDRILNAAKVLPFKGKIKKPWLSEDTFCVLEAKRRARLAGNYMEYRIQKGIFKAKAKQDVEKWYADLAITAEQGARRGDTKLVFNVVNQLSGRRQSQCAPITKADGSPCLDSEESSKCWYDHFLPTLNRPPAATCFLLDQFRDAGAEDRSTVVSSPAKCEIQAAIRHLKNGRAPGEDGIYPEFLKCADGEIAEMFEPVFRRVWESGLIPQEWKDAIILPVYKGKGSRTSCNSYRPISLLSVPGKVFVIVLISRIKQLLLDKRRPNQSGFTPNRSCTDAILALRILGDIHRAFSRPLYVAYLDIESAFDSVDRGALWKLLQGKGVPKKILDLLRQLHSDNWAKVRSDQLLSESFRETSGVRQGCVAAPWLFNEAIDWTMGTMSTSTAVCVGEFTFTDMDYADDAAVLVSREGNLAAVLHAFRSKASTVGLRPSWRKTKIQNVGAGDSPQSLQIGNEAIESVESFTYLGSIIHSSGYCSPDILKRIGMAGSVMNRLTRVWKQRHLSVTTKIRIYSACVLSTLLYGAEAWTLLQRDQQRLQAFNMQCQRRILGVRWFHRVTNAAISQQTQLPNIVDVIYERQHRFFGHVRRLEERAPARQALRLAVRMSGGWRPDASWRRPRGRPRMTWLNSLCTRIGLTPTEAWETAADRERWRALRPPVG